LTTRRRPWQRPCKAAGPGRGPVGEDLHGDWLKERGPAFAAGIKAANPDPFRGYASAIRDELPEAIVVVGAFYADVLLMPRLVVLARNLGEPGVKASA